jgi:hypothetical protein
VASKRFMFLVVGRANILSKYIRMTSGISGNKRNGFTMQVMAICITRRKLT